MKWTTIQAEGLRSLLPKNSIRVEMGMRSAEPSIERALLRLQNWGADHLVLLPLFPQFSTTTTGTCFTEVRTALHRLGWQPTIDEIADWADHLSMQSCCVAASMPQSDGPRRNAMVIPSPFTFVFSAHSLPLKIVKTGRSVPAGY